MSRPIRIGMVAGELSGDILGAGLIRSIRSRYPDAVFEGIGGERMKALGFRSHVPMERLSVMGIGAVLQRLPELLKVRRKLSDYFLDDPPDLFIGIDAPDFTLKLEGWLKEGGIPTVHYVSPSVWAWKKKRIYSIYRTTDLVLALFPFEPEHYAETGQRIAVVGHPLASQLPDVVDRQRALKRFAVADDETIVGILPGSRGSEITHISRPFLDTARWVAQRRPDIRFIIPAANEKLHDRLSQLIQRDYNDLNIQLVLKNSREVMAISDAILIASGTATLEALLMGTPMVVGYKAGWLTYQIFSRMVNLDQVSLPNILAGEALVPELIQDALQPEQAGTELLHILQDQTLRHQLQQRFADIHDTLNMNADERAADAVLGLLYEKGVIESAPLAGRKGEAG
ncbi:MAG: lipid-A-disaccharide synthase [Marinobacterium sp.]|nr:lipid-A-disaccharide synthase [Marinobacterium sp.]